jgi:hypothetical protein
MRAALAAEYGYRGVKARHRFYSYVVAQILARDIEAALVLREDRWVAELVQQASAGSGLLRQDQERLVELLQAARQRLGPRATPD